MIEIDKVLVTSFRGTGDTIAVRLEVLVRCAAELDASARVWRQSTILGGV